MDDPAPIPLSALQHYLYCPRQCALIHVEQRWAENRHTAEGRLLHQQVDQSQAERRKGVRTVTAMPLSAPALGIAGVADVVEFHHDGSSREQPFPVEYKRGRPKPHRADEVQLCAQALCLEHMLGQTIPVGALFYGKIRRRKEIAFDISLRRLTMDIIHAVGELLRSGRTPLAEYAPRRCDACSLIEWCQPRLLARHGQVAAWVREQLEN